MARLEVLTLNRYSFSTGALFPLESEDALQRIKNAGFDNAELMPQALSDASEAATRTFEKTGIRIASIHFPLAMFGMLYTAHRTMRDDGRRFTRDLLTMGRRMGTAILVVHPHSKAIPGYEALLEQPIIDNLRYLADTCADFGVLLAMENSPKTCATAEQLQAYVDSFGPVHMRPMVDTTEVCEAGGDPVQFLGAIQPCHLHLSDFSGTSKHLPAGEGDIDWAGVKAQLGDYTGFYTLEPSYRYYLEDIDARLRRAHAFIAGLFPDA